MSLVNVGVQLAQSGRKVLLVDFDLEAPGLPTFSLKKPKEDVPGVVEYVSHYIETGESADVNGFFYESEQFENGGGLWVMPVGRQDASYSYRLNSIDWRKLYAEQSGYLFFEDLKKQWAETIAPDYVLIDSRTGHSDVEGICTRQLPNAVTLLFFPNEQNLHGLKRIVSNINADNSKSQSKNIRVHFAVSNVPDLDDEDQILVKTLQKFKKELDYKELAAEIHHYNSLSLLNQEIFSLTHPNSRLTKEYKALTGAITKYNLEDREAVLAFLKSAHRNLHEVMYDEEPKELEDKIQQILKNFPQDGEVIFRVALIFEQLGNGRDALTLLSDPFMEEHYAIAPLYATKARLSRSLGDDPREVLDDLSAMLNADSANIETFLEAAPLMEQLNPELFDQIPSSLAFKSLSERDQEFLAFQFDASERQLKAKIDILTLLQNENLEKASSSKRYLTSELVLASIAIGSFDSAIDLLKPEGVSELALNIQDAFNLAMAIWGRDGKPSVELFTLVTQKNHVSAQDSNAGANYLQCMAISYAVQGLGPIANAFLSGSRSQIRRVPSREFSAWTYSKVSPQEFTIHLDEISRFIDGEALLPRFITNNILKH